MTVLWLLATERRFVYLIICDRAYFKELERRMKAARKQLPREAAAGVDAEIEAVEALGDPMYSTPVMATAFRITHTTLRHRVNDKNHSFQGHLPPFAGGAMWGDWFAACAVNKDTMGYRTWVDPNDAIKALKISHRLNRYSSEHGNLAQTRIDRWRLKNDHGNSDQENEAMRR